MSYIGTLEQFHLSTTLQKIEGDAHDGLLIIRQEPQWVELSFRQGQLMCIGPIRSNKTLGDRLLQAGVISQKALREVSTIPDVSLHNETRTVIALIDLGYLNQDNLYIWAAQEASKVLQVLLSWTTGEIYFEEGVQPPSDRLLVALAVSSLVPLKSRSTPEQSASTNIFSTHAQEQPKFQATSVCISDAATLHSPSQFYGHVPRSSTSTSLDLSEGDMADVMKNTDGLTSHAAPGTMLKRFTEALTPRRVDTSFMQPHMVLNPTDLSGLRERNLRLQFSPEQWRLFTRVDGNTSLQKACQQLVMSRELVCQVAGELVALGLVTVSLPDSGSSNDLAPFPLDVTKMELSSSSVMQTASRSDPFSPPPIETHSQWGNGGTGATFFVGNGWIVDSSQSQSLQPGDLSNSRNNEYAEASGKR
jgi:Domain of unknown function (DUF4388)